MECGSDRDVVGGFVFEEVTQRVSEDVGVDHIGATDIREIEIDAAEHGDLTIATPIPSIPIMLGDRETWEGSRDPLPQCIMMFMHIQVAPRATFAPASSAIQC
jgi:hypothetical protein